MRARRNRLLFASRRKSRPGCLMFVLLLAFLLGLGFGLNALNNGYPGLVQETVRLPGLDEDLEGFRILHISDLHAAEFGTAQERVKRLLGDQNYQAVCLTGDMVGLSGNTQPLLDLLDIFPDDVPVFLIAGDNDPPPLEMKAHGDSAVKADFVLAAEEHGAVYLDSPYQVTRGKRTIWFSPSILYTTDLEAAEFSLTQRKADLQASGEVYTPDGGAAARLVDYQLETLARSREAAALMRPEDMTILLGHFPLDDTAISQLHQGEREARKAVNFPGTVSLVLAGHWNNGQWRLPFGGPLRVPGSMLGLRGWLPGDDAISGLALVYAVYEYISPGLGASGAYPWQPFRLLNKPQMTILKLSSR